MRAFAAWTDGMPMLARRMAGGALLAGAAGGIAGLVAGLIAAALSRIRRHLGRRPGVTIP